MLGGDPKKECLISVEIKVSVCRELALTYPLQYNLRYNYKWEKACNNMAGKTVKMMTLFVEAMYMDGSVGFHHVKMLI